MNNLHSVYISLPVAGFVTGCFCVYRNTCRYGKSGLLRVDGHMIGTTESAGILTSLDTSGSVFVGQLLDHYRNLGKGGLSGSLGREDPRDKALIRNLGDEVHQKLVICKLHYSGVL